MSVQDINETHEVTDAELDAVSGGWFCFGVRAPISRVPGDQSGNNDPAQMFAQIMQQMTGG